ncbi:MAG: delta-60 repeat domain-containing protein [Pirellulaceae bacterium]
MHLFSEAGDWVGGGEQIVRTEADGPFTFLEHSWGVEIRVNNSEFWKLNFAAPSGQSFVPGVYEDAQRAYFNDFPHPGLDIAGDGRGCNSLSGDFVVYEADIGDTNAFHASFVQYCDSSTGLLYGDIRYKSSREASAILNVEDGLNPALMVDIAATSISEGDGPNATTVTVTRTTSTAEAVLVSLTSSDTSEAVTLANVTIPAGQTSAVVQVDAIDDLFVDGTQTVTITASAVGFSNGADTVDVTDDDLNTLTLVIDNATLPEAGGSAQATISRNSSVGDLIVDLSTDDASEISLPATVTIAGGQSSATFTINAIDDMIPDGLQRVNISASANGFIGDTEPIEVNEVQDLSIVASVDAEVEDGNGDGIFDSIDHLGTSVLSQNINNFLTRRGLFDFDLSAIPATTHIASAELLVDVGSFTSGSPIFGPTADFHGYGGNGVLAISDATESDGLVGQITNIDLGINSGSIDTAFLQSLLGTSNFAGLVMRSENQVSVRSIESSFANPKPTLRLTTGYRGELSITIDAAQILETGTTTATITRNNDDIELPLVVALTSDDPSEVSIPATVTIPANETSVDFTVTGVDDLIADDTQTVTISGNANQYFSSGDSLDVVNVNVPAALTLTIDPSTINENGGTTQATVSRSIATASPLIVSLASGDTSEATVIGSVTIPSGQTTSAPFSINAVDDAVVDGTQTVTITATADTTVGLDSSFGTGGIVTTDLGHTSQPPRMASGLQPDGKIVSASQGAEDDEMRVMRHNADGTPDTSFGVNGLVVTTFPVGEIASPRSIVVQANGKILIGGHHVRGFGSPFLVQLNADGTLDTNYGTNGIANLSSLSATWIEDMELTPDGKILAAMGINGTVRFRVMRVRADGNLDTFGSNGIVDFSGATYIASAISVMPDGRFLLMGDSISDGRIVRAHADGTLDSSFGTSGSQMIDFGTTRLGLHTLQIDSRNRIIIGATVSDGSGYKFAAARLHFDGTFDTSFNGDGIATTDIIAGRNDFARTTHVQLDGKVIVVGDSDPASGSNLVSVVRYHEDGSLDASFADDGTFQYSSGNNANQLAFDSVLQPDGRLVVLGGWFNDIRLARLNMGSNVLPGTATVEVTDNDFAELTVSIVAAAINESDGAGATTATVSRNTDTTDPLTVTLASSDPSEAMVVGSVTIAAGQASANFDINAVDDAIVDGAQTVTITASAAGHADGTDSVVVTDDDVNTLTLTIDNAELQEDGGSAQATIQRNSSDGDLVVDLSSDDASELSLPATVTIPDGQTSAVFTIDAIDDLVPDGLQRVTVTASTNGFVGDSGLVEVNELQEISIVASVDAEVQTNFGSTENIFPATTNIYAVDYSTLRLGILEFDVSNVPPSMPVSMANLILDVNYAPTGSGGVRPLANLYGYIGDGVTTLDDALQTNFVVAQVSGVTTGLNISSPIDMPYLQPLLGTQDFAGFVMRSDRIVGFRSIENTLAAPKPTLRLTSGYRGALAVTFDTSSISETGGTIGTITRNNDDIESPLVVTLTNSDGSELTIPSSVVIPANQTSISIAIQGVNDGINDGTQTVTIDVEADQYFPAAGSIDVTNILANEISITIDQSSISENGGTAIGTIHRNTNTPLTIDLVSNDSSEATVPATLTFAAGELSKSFEITGQDDGSFDGNQLVHITASANGFVDAEASIFGYR